MIVASILELHGVSIAFISEIFSSSFKNKWSNTELKKWN